MLSKFETKSNRVKGLSFHPKRPWILASLHNGSLQLWDYKMGTLIDRFDEHEGPVRGIAFHPTQPLFVSGGDDYKIKVWNWKQRKCLFTLNGHIDYIRTVFFHHEQPWIISCADDQTIRIWNWQSRTCIAILTGHNHYVMCAQFHPKEDLVVSASLDQTVRVWDISGLRKKQSSPQSAMPEDRMGPGQQPDIFGSTDAIVKYVLEGHDRAVNWATFHPNLPLIISGGDDRNVKLWRMNESKAWEVDTCRGHYSNVSCAIFHPRQELIISNSEDKTIRVWDMTKRTVLQTFRREHDRYWVLAAHPELNLFAAGHDNGLIVFKLERERPAHSVHQNTLFYVKDKFLRAYDFSNSNDTPLVSIRRPAGLSTAPRSLSYNPAEHSVLLTTAVDGGTYELHNLPRDARGEPRDAVVEPKKGQGNAAVYIARNRFAVFVKSSQQIIIKDLANETKKTFKPPVAVNDIFFAGTKNILLTTSSSVILFDTESSSNIAELPASGVRYAVWSSDMSMVALLSKHSIIIATKSLEQLSVISETIKIKSGAWDENGILVYSTLNHVKYALPQGDHGIIRTLEQPVYITRVKGKSVYCLDRDAKVRVLSVDPTEYLFKLALVRRNYSEVLRIIRNSNLVGQSIIAYLKKKGYPEIALHFVKDPVTRFELALECGNLEVALETAKVMDREDCWTQLGAEALKQGNHQVLEMTYQRIKNFDRLSFLYLITGNVEKLKKMQKIAELRNDVMSRYHNSLYLGDIQEQIRILKDAGQGPLAYLAAQTHGLTEEADSILAAAGLESRPELPDGGELLKTPTPIFKQHEVNWPSLTISRGIFDAGLFQSDNPTAAPVPMDIDPLNEDVGDWGDDADLDIPELGTSSAKPSAAKAAVDVPIDLGEGEGWDLDADLDIPGELMDASLAGAAASQYVPPTAGTPIGEHWLRNSGHAADHIAAGSFETAMQLLNRQVGAVNFAPLKPWFMSIYQASHSYLSANASVPPLALANRRVVDQDLTKSLPYSAVSAQLAMNTLQEAYAVTKAGKFNEALNLFKVILQQVLFVIVERREAEEVQQLVSIAREYILGLRMEVARKDVSIEANPKRAVELAAYFSHCQLQPAHLQLSLRSAMLLAFKIKNYATAAIFARRLLELGPVPTVGQQAQKLLALCERTPTDEIQLDYDQYNPFVVCGSSFSPIYRGSPSVQCPYCKASYKPEFQGQLCEVCEISQIGASASGLRSTTENR
ncbi:coatomer WD associated region-domain-containing protein [Polychytrium aggregatum]|uniref:coatomer WD associated region-domain-containing protein n=1 Tax=Polychytrium aggregatum TaxID=110093 RepID=UPI0022FEEB4E|nr:coatomer WD associated region-domain-containing protein [Polychytrium aggregatum]KAI9207062.1 coatomer WD associated region-domain-containing protein [Polychytrium aggregatum]